MDGRFFIVYPERRAVTGEQLIAWAKDDIANGLSDYCDQPQDVTGVDDAIAVLADSGSVTVLRPGAQWP
jgi:hypothetical protein